MTTERDANLTYTNTSGRDANLNQTAAHDSALYDPSAPEDRIVTLYETSEAAAAAKAVLVRGGVPEAQLRVVERTQADQEASAYDDPAQVGGLLHMLKSLFGGGHNEHGYSEAVHRGHALLVVHPEAGRRQDTVHLLETTNPVDFDARLEEWRSAGWDNMAAQQTAAAAPAGTATVYDTATHTSKQESVSRPAGTDTSGSHPVDLPTLMNTTGTPKPPV